jgi:hypothetical protein
VVVWALVSSTAAAVMVAMALAESDSLAQGLATVGAVVTVPYAAFIWFAAYRGWQAGERFTRRDRPHDAEGRVRNPSEWPVSRVCGGIFGLGQPYLVSSP